MKLKLIGFIILSTLSISFADAQGSYAPPVGSIGTTAIHKDSSAIVSWATGCTSVLGLQNIADANSGLAATGDNTSPTGKSGLNGVLSLGDGGMATLTFANPITNGIGPDFAVFENSFSNTFLELAVVEVSSDGANFFRFPATSETQDTLQISGFGSIDATYIHNLAGKYKAQFGTPFDLDDVANIFGLDINAITHVRVIDVVGSINDAYATYDAQGNKINDPFPTPFASGGFDLDAVAVLHEATVSIAEQDKVFSVFPNPTNGAFRILGQANKSYAIINALGKIVKKGKLFSDAEVIDCTDLPKGIYFVKINNSIVKLILN